MSASQGAASRARLEAGVARTLARLPHGLLQALLGRPVVVDGQRLNVEVQLVLKLLELGNTPPLDRLSVEQARAQIVAEARYFRGREVPVARVDNLPIPGGGGEIAGRLYVPHERNAGGGLLVYFHGGGFVVGDLETHDNTCRFLAHEASVSVLAVDYRRAPEHRFPAATEDAWAAFRYAVDHAAELGAAPHRVAVAGDSAGGNLAAGVALRAAAEGAPAPAFQLLFYPWLDLSAKRDSYRLFGTGFFLTEGELDWYSGHYLADSADSLDERCSPLRAEPAPTLAPAFVVSAGFDPLRDEAEEYARRLRAAGVRVALRRHPGLVHGFVNALGLGHVGRDALLEAAGALRTGLA